LVTKKNILITAGPTWVAIDRVRVISNLASGETGFILADKFRKLGAAVTLLLGPGNYRGLQKNIKLIRFNYFSELASLLDRELKTKKFTAVIHAAAVADFRPERVAKRKISSLRKNWRLNLIPTKKLIKGLKKYQTDLFTVGFKFEPDLPKDKLLYEAGILLKESKLNLVVANSSRKLGYQAYILNKGYKYGPFLSKTKMAACLSVLVMDKAGKRGIN
jgi:phosphopantothenoylcysteine decarboxylase/phosphopantothenate--cysteine ligase